MIKPTVGRVVLYRPVMDGSIACFPDQPLAATVAYVWHDRMVNLSVADANGLVHSRTSVPLVQPGDAIPNYPYCEWMPYQLEQAECAQHERTLLYSGHASTPIKALDVDHAPG